MRLPILVGAAMLALAAGCDRGNESAKPSSPPAPSSTASGGSTTSTTPANTGAASQAERKEGTAPPVQGQVDAKQAEQHKDFQQRGDGAGPTSPDTKPKPGG